MIDYTRKFKTECAKLKLDPQVRAMAELMVQEWSAQDAFVVMGFNKPHLSDEYNKKQLEKITHDEDFIKYMETRQRSIKRARLRQYDEDEDTDKPQIKLMNKEEILQEALQSALSLPVTDKNRVEILMKYADLAQMKKEEIKEEDTTIHYYLPLSCNNCSLYIANKKKKSGV